MKKVIVSMMLAGALLTGSTMFAQTKTDGSTGATTQKECCQNGGKEKCTKKGDKDKSAKKGLKGNKGQRTARPPYNPFDGIQLTDDQQQKLQVLQQGLGPVVLDKEQQEKIKENPNLTPEQKQQLKEERKAKKQEAKKNYLQGVKETLTPDQYVIFLENFYLYSPQSQGDKMIKQQHKGGAKSKTPQGKKQAKEKK